MTAIQAGGPAKAVQPRGRHHAILAPQPAPPGPDEADEPIRYEINPQPAAGALILMQVGKLYESVGLRFTEKDRNDWILAVDLLIEAALTRVTVAITTT
jgi:hypothetical protein